jgi:hypothetical protein
MEYADKMGSGVIPSFINVGTGIKKLIREGRSHKLALGK